LFSNRTNLICLSYTLRGSARNGIGTEIIHWEDNRMATTVWRGHISFGLISIPVRLFRAARAERVKLRQLYRVPAEAASQKLRPTVPSVEWNGGATPGVTPAPHSDAGENEAVLAPVRRAAVSEDDREPIPDQAVEKGYEFEKGRFVAIGAEELKAIAPKTATEMEILEFVRLQEVDPVYFETSYYVAPEEAGEKPYSLLYRALQETGLVAVARFAMHGREHIVILRPGSRGVLCHTMYFNSEIRADQEYRADPSVVAKKELDLAKELIHSLAIAFDPATYRDTFRDQLEALIAAKVEGREPAATTQRAVASPVIDIADALRKSLAAVKKPPAAAKKATASTRKPHVEKPAARNSSGRR
jgi:DNA end-binding protein Ku